MYDVSQIGGHHLDLSCQSCLDLCIRYALAANITLPAEDLDLHRSFALSRSQAGY